MTADIDLAKQHSIIYFLTPENTAEMHGTDRNIQAFADAVRLAERERVAEDLDELARMRKAEDSIVMLVARLENLQKNGDTWLTVAAVLAMIGDCEMLASRDNAPPD